MERELELDDGRTRLFSHKQRQQCLSLLFIYFVFKLVITNKGERHQRATLYFYFSCNLLGLILNTATKLIKLEA